MNGAQIINHKSQIIIIMWNKIQYALIYSWVKVHALLPMWALYILSDILYVLIYKIIRYRVKVVRQNMKASFPEKSDTELRRLEREFYHHFADYVVETIKLAHISLEELQRRAFLKNPELVDKLMEKGHTCFILLMGHYGNWEWFSGSTSRFQDSRIYQIYRPLSNQAFDRLFINLRTKFGSFGIKKQDTVRDVITLKKNKTRCVVIFIADQTPSRNNLHYWTNFLNQDSSILTGHYPNARAVYEARKAFHELKPSYKLVRRENLAKTKLSDIPELRKRSLIIDFYLQRKKKFTEL